MKIITSRVELQKVLNSYKQKKTKVGLVPTMGALHRGHLSLVSTALLENECVVVSVFVNPTQFDNATDLKKYPRTLEEDVTLLKTLQGDIIIFNPDATDLYEGEVRAKNYTFGSIANQMEGKFRTGHFDGVGTVVNLLLRAVEPNKAYFGQKDFQQLQIVKKLVSIENLPVTIVGCPIVREENGLAMSSRNKRLSKKEFEDASLIFETLKKVQEQFRSNSFAQLYSLVKEIFENQDVLTLEYFEIADEATLKTVHAKKEGKSYRGFIAAFIGPVRLIDNMPLN